MNSEKFKPGLLATAFLFQAVASLISQPFLLRPLIVDDSIIDNMTNISNKVMQMLASIIGEILTAIWIFVLGVLLYENLKNQNRKIAFIALGVYIIEAGLLIANRTQAFSLLTIKWLRQNG